MREELEIEIEVINQLSHTIIFQRMCNHSSPSIGVARNIAEKRFILAFN